MSAYPRVRPVGDAALTFELGDVIDPQINARVRALERALLASPFPGFVEATPTYRSLLVAFDPSLTSFADASAALRERLPAASEAAASGALRVIPTLYDGADLESVARAAGLRCEDVVGLHSGREYTAFMLGFAPGFAYLGSLDEALSTPRRATPRVRVPAGAVGIAGLQTAVYPRMTAGGWNLIGRTSLRLFDAQASPPCLIEPGDRVRFEPVSALPEAAEAPRTARIEAAAIEVLHGGLLTTIQDGGRRGHRRLGVGGAGAMDAPALAAANAALGNPPGAAGLECTIEGPSLRFLTPVRFAIAGGDLTPTLLRADLGDWPVPAGTAVLGRAGNVLAFRGRRSGCRAYVAFAGGLEVPEVLGSRSTDLCAGFGGLEGRALRTGDLLGLVRLPDLAAPIRAAPASFSAELHVILGPQDDLFDLDAVARLLSSEYVVLSTSDRVACRLEGHPIAPRGAAEIVSDGMLPGSIQVPPDGQPIVMLAEAPTTGGYPKIATVVSADLPRLAQLVPGEGRVRFARA